MFLRALFVSECITESLSRRATQGVTEVDAQSVTAAGAAGPGLSWKRLAGGAIVGFLSLREIDYNRIQSYTIRNLK